MKIGFIGTGNMGSAIAISASNLKDIKIYLSNRTISKAKVLQEKNRWDCM